MHWNVVTVEAVGCVVTISNTRTPQDLLAYLCAHFLVSGFFFTSVVGINYKGIVREDYSEEENICMC